MLKELLKPCPFCGGKAQIKEEQSYGDPPHYHIICTQCGAQGGFSGLYLDGDTVEDCIKNCEKTWNKRVENAPTADVVEVVHGEWIEQHEKPSWLEDDIIISYICSICGTNNFVESPYCPNCGAKMDGERRKE